MATTVEALKQAAKKAAAPKPATATPSTSGSAASSMSSAISAASAASTGGVSPAPQPATQSAAVSGTATTPAVSGGAGTYTPKGAGTYDASMMSAADYAQSQANSAAWKEASDRGDRAAMDYYHAGNEALRDKYSYSGGSDGSQYVAKAASQPAQPAYNAPAANISKPRDNSSLINAMYRQATEANVNRLKDMLKNQQAQLDYEAGKVAPEYDQARQAVSGNAAISRANMNESLAARGLSTSGAAAQLDFSSQNALTGSLASLYRSEAEAIADIQQRRSQIAADYNSQIALAYSQGDTQRMQAIISERGRVDQMMMQSEQFIANYGLQVANMRYQADSNAYNNNFNWMQYQDNQKQRIYENDFNERQYNSANAFTEAGLTGDYNGQRTVAGQQVDNQTKSLDAELQANGLPTSSQFADMSKLEQANVLTNALAKFNNVASDALTYIRKAYGDPAVIHAQELYGHYSFVTPSTANAGANNAKGPFASYS